MPIKQLSLFVENQPGSLSKVCQVLKENRINISTLSLAHPGIRHSPAADSGV